MKSFLSKIKLGLSNFFLGLIGLVVFLFIFVVLLNPDWWVSYDTLANTLFVIGLIWGIAGIVGVISGLIIAIFSKQKPKL